MTTNNLKIALSGFPGTGKTTLANALGQRLGLPVIAENMRPLANADANFVIAQAHNQNKDIPQLAQILIGAFLSWDASRGEEYVKHDGFIADRWEADLLDWWLARFGKGVLAVDDITGKLLMSFQTKAENLDYVILMPLRHQFSADANDDGIKRTNRLTAQIRTTAMVRGLLASFTNLPIISLPNAPLSVEQRVDFIINTIAAHQAKLSNARP